jgi:hypothetical protein
VARRHRWPESEGHYVLPLRIEPDNTLQSNLYLCIPCFVFFVWELCTEILLYCRPNRKDFGTLHVVLQLRH